MIPEIKVQCKGCFLKIWPALPGGKPSSVRRCRSITWRVQRTLSARNPLPAQFGMPIVKCDWRNLHSPSSLVQTPVTRAERTVPFGSFRCTLSDAASDSVQRSPASLSRPTGALTAPGQCVLRGVEQGYIMTLHSLPDTCLVRHKRGAL